MNVQRHWLKLKFEKVGSSGEQAGSSGGHWKLKRMGVRTRTTHVLCVRTCTMTGAHIGLSILKREQHASLTYPPNQKKSPKYTKTGIWLMTSPQFVSIPSLSQQKRT